MNQELDFIDMQITPLGGMALMRHMLDYIGWDQALDRAGLPQAGSNRGYAPEQLVGQFMLSVWCGANRFEHMEVSRYDHVPGSIFGNAHTANSAIAFFAGKPRAPGSKAGVLIAGRLGLL